LSIWMACRGRIGRRPRLDPGANANPPPRGAARARGSLTSRRLRKHLCQAMGLVVLRGAGAGSSRKEGLHATAPEEGEERGWSIGGGVTRGIGICGERG
jgi:hypothetical protein